MNQLLTETGYAQRKRDLRTLADTLEAPDRRDCLANAYLADTSFLVRDIVRREVEIPAALLRLPRQEETLLADRQPLGRVVVMMPRNSLGFTLAKAVAGSYLAGNTTTVYFPSSLKKTGPVYAELLRTCLSGTDIAPFNQSSALFMRSCLRDPEVRAVVIYGDDSWIDSYIPLARETGTKIIFEGPGNDPLVVMPDADLDEAVAGAIACGLNNGGQSCSAIERFFIHEDILEAFRDRLVERLAALAPGDPSDPATSVGPIASRVIFQRILRQLEESIAQGAQLVHGGKVVTEPRTGLPILMPAVLTGCSADMPLVRNETFGPVFPLVAFRETEALLGMLADTRYGLNASIYGTAPEEVVTYLESTHRNFYQGSTSVSPENLPTRLLDGGFGRSGLVWDFNEVNQPRSGRRNIAVELSLPS